MYTSTARALRTNLSLPFGNTPMEAMAKEGAELCRHLHAGWHHRVTMWRGDFCIIIEKLSSPSQKPPSPAELGTKRTFRRFLLQQAHHLSRRQWEDNDTDRHSAINMVVENTCMAIRYAHRAGIQICCVTGDPDVNRYACQVLERCNPCVTDDPTYLPAQSRESMFGWPKHPLYR